MPAVLENESDSQEEFLSGNEGISFRDEFQLHVLVGRALRSAEFRWNQQRG
jgi:hypothetical protein